MEAEGPGGDGYHRLPAAERHLLRLRARTDAGASATHRQAGGGFRQPALRGEVQGERQSSEVREERKSEVQSRLRLRFSFAAAVRRRQSDRRGVAPGRASVGPRPEPAVARDQRLLDARPGLSSTTRRASSFNSWTMKLWRARDTCACNSSMSGECALRPRCNCAGKSIRWNSPGSPGSTRILERLRKSKRVCGPAWKTSG